MITPTYPAALRAAWFIAGRELWTHRAWLEISDELNDYGQAVVKRLDTLQTAVKALAKAGILNKSHYDVLKAALRDITNIQERWFGPSTSSDPRVSRDELRLSMEGEKSPYATARAVLDVVASHKPYEP